eukprot:CAMPEP_0169434308 /NCGR_PEP_ID=MMETSP1042-20121227/4461_1 /TAXON_ID=464988 /ORGANISM="Hemiselmis andersenii, Strain CCMP1180" /LENGTH=655 /DNA_ID=CAMNT_0009544877 /DNA_START=78 /DNA_END=2045 /DNA_ORIENTATION=+
MTWIFLLLLSILNTRDGEAEGMVDRQSCRRHPVPVDQEQVCVSVSVSTSQSGGMDSIWDALEGAADRVCLHVAAGAGTPHIPAGFAGCVEVFQEEDRRDGADCVGGPIGFQVVLEDAIVYPREYIEVVTSVVEAYGRSAVVGYDGAVWNRLDLRKPVLVSTDGISQAVALDTWVDVLRLGTVAFHAQAFTGNTSKQDWSVGRFLPVRTGLEDVRWAAAVHHAGVARVVAYHAQGWLGEAGDHGKLGRGKGLVMRAVASDEGGDEGLLMAGHFAPWRTMFDDKVPNTQRAEIRREDGFAGNVVAYTVDWVEVSQSGYGGACDSDASEGDPEDESCGTAADENVGNVTVVIPVFWRPRLAFLRETVRGLVQMKVVDRVIVINNNPDWFGVTFQGRGCEGKVFVVRGQGGGAGLNARFLPRALVRTDGVVSMDDDFRPTEDQVNSLVKVWQAFPSRLVGPMWLTTRHTECHGGNGSVEGCIGHVYGMGGWKGYYNMILTGMAVWHRGYMPLYWAVGGAMDSVRAQVEQGVNCEDIAMNFLVAFVQRKSPVAMDVGVIVENKLDGGLSGRGGAHYAHRTGCINSFVRSFGLMPLINCTTVSPYRNSFHAFESDRDAQEEAAGGDEGADALRCAWDVWEGASEATCGLSGDIGRLLNIKS